MNHPLFFNKKWFYFLFLFFFISSTIQSQSNFDVPNLEKVFNLNELPKITLKVNSNDWNALLAAYDTDFTQNYWFEGTYVFEESSILTPVTLQRIGLRVRGNTSRNRPEGVENQLHDPINPIWNQSSFALRFDRNVNGQTFEGLTRLDLKYIREDPTRVREVYSFDLLQQEKIFSGPLISYCRLYLQVDNETPGYFGVFKMKEYIEDDYLNARQTYFGDAPTPGPLKSFLWKGDSGAALNDPAQVSNQTIYDLRTNTGSRATAEKQLQDFITNLTTLEGNELKTWAESTIDVPVLLKTYLLSIICGNMDDYWFNSNNYNFYFNTYGKFYLIPNDFDTSLGTGFSIDAGRQDVFNWGNINNPLILKLLTIPEYNDLYKNIFLEVTQQNKPFSAENSISRIQQWQNTISSYLWDDTIHDGCENDAAGCIRPDGTTKGLQTPYGDNVAWWVDVAGPNKNYKLLDLGSDNFFTISGDPNRVNNNKAFSKVAQPNYNLNAPETLNETELNIIGNSVQIAPNPVYDKFTIYITGEAQTRVTKLNITGVNNTFNNLITVEPKKNNYEVDLFKLSKGVYVVQMTLNTGQTITKKVIKN